MLGTSHNVVMAPGRFTAVCALCSCKVNFQPPTMSLGSNINLAIGPESSVQLTTTFLDDRLRLGRGSRGSRFVFVRGGYADEAGAHMCTPYASLPSSCRLCFEHIPTRLIVPAGMDRIGLQTTTAGGWATLGLGLALLLTGTWKLAHGSSIVSKGLAVLTGLLTGAIATVCWRGGQR